MHEKFNIWVWFFFLLHGASLLALGKFLETRIMHLSSQKRKQRGHCIGIWATLCSQRKGEEIPRCGLRSGQGERPCRQLGWPSCLNPFFLPEHLLGYRALMHIILKWCHLVLFFFYHTSTLIIPLQIMKTGGAVLGILSSFHNTILITLKPLQLFLNFSSLGFLTSIAEIIMLTLQNYCENDIMICKVLGTQWPRHQW